MGPNNIWVKNNHGSKQKLCSKKIWSKKKYCQKNVGSKKNCDAKNVWSKEIMCPKNSLISNYFSLKQNVAQKVLVPKIKVEQICGFLILAGFVF